MSAEQDRLDWIRQWVGFAEGDLRNAENTLLMEDLCPFPTVCFHAQQCVEKYLKAVLSFRGIDFPKVHNVRRLMELVPEIAFPLSTDEANLLTEYATITRYPGASEPVTRVHACEAVSLARKMRRAAREHLPREALE